MKHYQKYEEDNVKRFTECMKHIHDYSTKCADMPKIMMLSKKNRDACADAKLVLFRSVF